MLRKCQLLGLPTMAQSIHVVSATRLVVGDLAESFHWVSLTLTPTLTLSLSPTLTLSPTLGLTLTMCSCVSSGW